MKDPRPASAEERSSFHSCPSERSSIGRSFHSCPSERSSIGRSFHSGRQVFSILVRVSPRSSFPKILDRQVFSWPEPKVLDRSAALDRVKDRSIGGTERVGDDVAHRHRFGDSSAKATASDSATRVQKRPP